jgi:hypothetical protein
MPFAISPGRRSRFSQITLISRRMALNPSTPARAAGPGTTVRAQTGRLFVAERSGFPSSGRAGSAQWLGRMFRASSAHRSGDGIDEEPAVW